MIAYTRLRAGSGAIYLVAPGPGTVRRLTGPERPLYDPAWSPDGSMLVALGPGDGGDQAVYLIDASTGEPRPIMVDGAPKLRPAWSPDGEEIVLELSVGRSGYHLFAIRPDGTGLRQITGPLNEADLPRPTATPAPTFAYVEMAPDHRLEVEEMPAWSPDGAEIVFVRPADRPRTRLEDPGLDHHIWRIARDGTGLRRLTHGAVHDLDPTYSPDGTRIAFTRYVDHELIRTQQGGHSAVRVWVMRADGSEPRIVTAEPAQYQSPSWSPDGTRLVCSRSVGGPSHLFVFEVDGSGGTALTDPEEDGDYAPAWSPVT
jgi:TolB protein